MKKHLSATPAASSALPFGPRNYAMMLGGIGAIILGFILLSGGGSEDPAAQFNPEMFNVRRLYVAPLLLLAGFLFEIYAIMYRPKDHTTDKKTE